MPSLLTCPPAPIKESLSCDQGLAESSATHIDEEFTSFPIRKLSCALVAAETLLLTSLPSSLGKKREGQAQGHP